MANIRNRYSSAVHSSNLKVSKEADKTGETVVEDTDALSAMAWADKALTTGWRTTGPDGKGEPVRPAPLAVSLERLLSGDNNAAYDIVRLLADMVWRHGRDVRIKVGRAKAKDIAQSCLAWFRHGTCKACGGHGFSLIPGVPSLSGHTCQACGGTRKIRLADAFPRPDDYELARWLADEIERNMGRAGVAAMRSLAPKLDLP